MSAGVTVAAVVLAGVGACYTSPINMKPTIRIVQQGTVKRGGIAMFMAEVSDPQSDRVDWTHSESCEKPGTVWVRDTPTYSVGAPDTDKKFCVWATVRDRYGATADAVPLPVDPNNRPPEAIIDAALAMADPFFPSTPFPLFRTIRLDANPSSDPDFDTLTFTWEVVAGPDPERRLDHCDPDGLDETMRCLTPTVAGRYMVRLTAADGYGGEDSVTEAIGVAPDGLPCLKTTVPARSAPVISARADELKTFTIYSVADDGDPLPGMGGGLGPPKFVWFFGKVGSELTRSTTVGRDVGYFEIPQNAFQLGDQVKVRVQVADRDTARSDDAFTRCGDRDTCFSESEGVCQQRMTWLVNYDQ